jgi:lysophospholipase L1-like esterase
MQTLRYLTILFMFSFSSFAQTKSTSKHVKFLALGDSYTIGESVPVEGRWPEQLAAQLRAEGYQVDGPQIIATTGWRTDDLKKAIEAANPDNDFTLVSLLIGVNNYYQGKTVESYAPEFEELLNLAVRFAGEKKENVFVVSIPDYGFTPFGLEKKEQISRGIDAYNKVNKLITEKHGIRYIYITDISRRGLDEPNLVAEDKLHPSATMYAEWVKQIREIMFTE